MTISLTPFEAMCGFWRIDDITELLCKNPEFVSFVSKEAKLKVFMCADDNKSQQDAIASAIFSFMNYLKEESLKQSELLLARIQSDQ